MYGRRLSEICSCCFSLLQTLQYVIVPAKKPGFAVMRKKVRVDVDADDATADLEVRSANILHMTLQTGCSKVARNFVPDHIQLLLSNFLANLFI